MLGVIGATSAASLVGGHIPWADAAAPPAPNGMALPACIVTPQQTEGPYFVDERLRRADIRTDPSNGSTKPGVPLALALNVTQLVGATCTPLAGAMVDIWQCDAHGAYSDVLDRAGNFADTRGQKFLRGYQLTDNDGRVEFMTIYPGWYRGRTVHIHFKVRTNAADGRAGEFTSQWYFDDAVSDAVFAAGPYASKGPRTTRNERDGIFRRGGSDLILPVAKTADRYAATFDIGLRMR